MVRRVRHRILIPLTLLALTSACSDDGPAADATSTGATSTDDVVVPADAVLGREGAGASIFSAVLDVERSYVFAPQVGAMERQLAAAISTFESGAVSR